jgi:LacI family transcriptional regulator
VIPHQPTYFSAHAILRGINQTIFQKEVPFGLTVFDTYPFASAEHATDGGAVLERSILERIDQEGVAGVIIWHLAGAETLPYIIRLQENGVAVVFIDRYPAYLDCDYVGADNSAGVKNAVEYLLDHGHQRIAYLTKSEPITPIQERLNGYYEAFLSRGLAPAPELTINASISPKAQSWKPAIEKLMSLADPPTAAVVVNDFQAFALIREAKELGIRIPEDLSIIGFDDIECYSPHPAMLTTVHQPFYEIGQRAADLLLRRLDNRAQPAVKSSLHVTLSTSLIVRSTSRALQ